MTHRVKARNIGQVLLRAILPLSILSVCLYLLSPHLTRNLMLEFPKQLAQIHWSAWSAASLLTLISLWTVGRYDGVAHQHFATRVPHGQARIAGTFSIAIAQTLGFGLFTGALVRWRLLRDVSFGIALKLSAFVSVSFMLCLAVVTALVCVLLPSPDWTFAPAMLVLLTLPIGIAIVFRWPNLTIGRFIFRFPNLSCSFAFLSWTLVDTVAMAGAIYVLLPSSAEISFIAFLPIFLLALGTALLSTTPDGVGPFELMMLGLLPQIPASEVLGSIVAFRIVYYAIPALCSLLALIRPFRSGAGEPSLAALHPTESNQAEVQIIAQNGGRILPTLDGLSAIWPTSQTITALFNPISGSMDAALTALKTEAASLGKIPLVYKCNSRNAAALRRHHWSIMHMSDDAMIAPQHFALNTPALRTLRRKLRAATKSGILIHTDKITDWPTLHQIDQDWQNTHGAARGGTMGRFEIGYLSTHFIARAEHHGRLCAFVTFQKGGNEWCLDVMRHTSKMPDGTMHALVHSAITAAKELGIERLSLAATPTCPDPSSRFFRWSARRAVSKAGGTGLRQFKSTFAPKWEPRYAAAQTPLSMAIGLADITREVHNPNKITPAEPRKIHNFDEYYELASKQAS
jgi:phosphatidylglycerol lysyltransferase